MSEAKHTPGPWEFGPNHSSTGLAGQLVVRPAGEFPHGEWVADVGSMYDDHREANASLIAAAPELLEALKLWLDIHDKPAGFIGKFGKSLTEAIAAQEVKVNAAAAAARAAIAKVEGGAA